MKETTPGGQAPASATEGTDNDPRVQQLLALHQAAVEITAELDLNNLLQRIVDKARQVVGCEYAALGVLGDDGFIKLFPTAGVSQLDREHIGAPPQGHGLLGVMLRAGRVLRIPDINTDPRRVGFPPNHPPMQSLLGVPLWVRGRLMGDLYLANKIGSEQFSDEDEWLVQLLATHATTALTNAELHAENISALAQARRERAHSEALFRVTEAINRSVNLQEVIELIVRYAAELLEAPGAALYTLEPDLADPQATPHFVTRYALGLTELLSNSQTALSIGRTAAGRAINSGQVQLTPDTRLEPEVLLPKLAAGELRAVAAVPISAGGRMLGGLSVYYDKPTSFDAEDISVLEAFAAAASTAVYNTQLYEEARMGREAAEREQRRLRELEQMKDEFLSTAAHELRTPLTTIRISAGLAHEQMSMLIDRGPLPLNPRLLDLVGLVVENSQRMQALVNDLLDLTRLEQGQTMLTLDKLDLRDLVSSAVHSVAPLFNEKKQVLSVRLPETKCLLSADRQRLERILVNLLSNANKYSPSGSQVEVRVIRTGQECQARVRDSGPGVPEEEREKIFERFYRSSLHRSDRSPGTGLGLPIARQIAEMHGGRLWVEQDPGGGSVFILSLPTSGAAQQNTGLTS